MNIYKYPYWDKELDNIEDVLATVRAGVLSEFCPFMGSAAMGEGYCTARCGSMIPDGKFEPFWTRTSVCPCDMADQKHMLTNARLERILIMVLRQHGRQA